MTTAVPAVSTVNYANGSASTRNSSQTGKTVLGKLRQNPFTVAEMTKAYNVIHNTRKSALPTTHTYIKFKPTSIRHIDLLEASGVILQDYPFEYEVITEGDYYQEPAQGEFPEFYGVVTGTSSISGVPYEVISSLHLDKSDPILVAQSYYQTGNHESIYSEVMFDTGLYESDIPRNTLTRIPPKPECEPGCKAILVPNTGVGNDDPIIADPGPGNHQIIDQLVWVCDCNPTPPPTPNNNNCGCPIPADSRIPAGCVQVFDTELSNNESDFSTYLPVRRVEVFMRDNWFSSSRTETDDNGCWSMPNERYSGRARMRVKFKNDRVRIRGSRDTWKIWELFLTVKHKTGRFKGPFNNIETNFNRGPFGSKTRRLWGSATVNNALHEFHDYTIADGILPPQNGLDVFIDHDATFGFAIMSTQNDLSAAAGAAVVAAAVTSRLFILAKFFSNTTWAVTKAYLPDVSIGYDFNNSDRLKELSFHEFAHASHHNQNGHSFWRDLVIAEIEADGHGDENSNNAGLISVCESWAHHLGYTYADRAYLGQTASISNTRSWLGLLERDINESLNHIPEGLYHDLMDNSNVNDPAVITDNVSGFTQQELFSCLTSNIRSVEEFRICLVNNHLDDSGNTLVQLNDLFNSY